MDDFMVLVPENEELCKQLLLDGRGAYCEGQIEVNVEYLKLSDFLSQFPIGSCFREKTTGKRYEISSEEQLLIEKIAYVLNTMQAMDIDVIKKMEELIEAIAMVKATYEIRISPDGCRGKIGKFP